MEWLHKIKEGALDILLPKKCVGCGREGKYLCQKCSLFLSEAPLIFPGGGLVEVISIWEYEGVIKKLIHQIKYQGLTDAITELVERVFELWEMNIPEDTYITYVPMEKKKEKKRGFNQAELIAEELGKILGKKVVPLLRKVRETRSQTELNEEERLINVKNAFSAISKVLPDNVLLVDDIWTTGATMKECSKVLKKAGVKNIFGFTLARTI